MAGALELAGGALLLALVGVQDPVEVDEPVDAPVAGPAANEEQPAEPAGPVGRPPFADPVPLESSVPIVTVVGSGAPEVLVWYPGERPGMEELTWRLEIAGAVGDLLEPGAGTVHLMTDLGAEGRGLTQVYEYLAEHPGIVVVGEVGATVAPELRRRPPENATDDTWRPRRAVGGIRQDRPAGQTPGDWLQEGLGLEQIALDRESGLHHGRWLRHPDGGPWIWSAYVGGSRSQQWEAWLEAYLGPEQRDEPILGVEYDFPDFDTDEPWPQEVVVVEDGISRTLSGASVHTGSEMAGQVMELLIQPARLSLAPAAAPLHLGGDLWQLDLTLAAPSLQPARTDALRTYPKARLVPAVAWGAPADAGATTVDALAPPRLVRLAWRPADAEHFELLPERGPGSGRFGFPGDDLPEGATLRLIVDAPGAGDAVGRVFELSLDAGRYGRASLRTQLTTD